MRSSVCSWKAFPAQSNDCGRGKEPTQEWCTCKVVHSGRLWPYPQSLDQAGKACQGQTPNTIAYYEKFVNYGQKKFYNIGPMNQNFQLSLKVFFTLASAAKKKVLKPLTPVRLPPSVQKFEEKKRCSTSTEFILNNLVIQCSYSQKLLTNILRSLLRQRCRIVREIRS